MFLSYQMFQIRVSHLKEIFIPCHAHFEYGIFFWHSFCLSALCKVVPLLSFAIAHGVTSFSLWMPRLHTRAVSVRFMITNQLVLSVLGFYLAGGCFIIWYSELNCWWVLYHLVCWVFWTTVPSLSSVSHSPVWTKNDHLPSFHCRTQVPNVIKI